MMYREILIFFLIYIPIQCMDTLHSSIDETDQYGKTALYKAITEFGTLEEVERILKLGADPNLVYCGSVTSPRGDISPLHAALSNKKPRLAYVSLLLKHRANPNKFNSVLCHRVDSNNTSTAGNTPLHNAIHFFRKPEMPGIVVELVKYGGDIGLQNYDGNTVFHIAAEHASMSACSLLINLLEQRQSIVTTLLLIHQRKGKQEWLPKPLLFLCMYEVLYVKQSNYESIRVILNKANKKKKTAYDIVSANYSDLEKKLETMQKGDKQYSSLTQSKNDIYKLKELLDKYR